MLTAISWLVVLGPLLLALLKKIVPKILSRIRGVGGKLTGNMEGLGGVGGWVAADLALGDTIKKTGAIGAVLLMLTRFWGWMSRFPSFLKSFFEVGGALYFLRPVLEFLLGIFKTPILLFLSLLGSAYFPTVLEKMFLLVGAATMKVFLSIFKIGKNVFQSAVNNVGQGGAVNEFKDAILGSFDQLPPCFISVMGYVHFIEDLGMLVTTATLLIIVSVFRVVYGSFGGVKPLGWFA